jgi:2-C-methyl-D-erythritol 4-phosphate cytidylyltransferase / 2-C-methyl-D-erythritol 2,4-cyclodiphosphate synthase
VIEGPTAAADAIIVAAGSSSRMAGVDKLLAEVGGGRTLLGRTIDAFAALPSIGAIAVVTTPDRRRRIERDAATLAGRLVFAAGGDRRQDSVRNGFLALERAAPDPGGERVVLVHDGARPMIDAALVGSVVHATLEHGAAIPVVPVRDTIKRVVDGRIAATEDRSLLVAAQTPQGVRRSILRSALADPIALTGTWTDEAALLEACKIAVHVVPGDPANIKVTVPADLVRVIDGAEVETGSRRNGIGHDSHPFGPGAPLRLGGIEIDGAPRLHGHSDGDVILHAIADGLLGAAGLGDLGRLYPAGPATPSGIASRELLGGVLERLAVAGWAPATVDLTVVGARPRLAGHLDAMRDAVAELLGIGREGVNLKASSGNLDGSTGAGRSLSALALVGIERRR